VVLEHVGPLGSLADLRREARQERVEIAGDVPDDSPLAFADLAIVRMHRTEEERGADDLREMVARAHVAIQHDEAYSEPRRRKILLRDEQEPAVDLRLAFAGVGNRED